MQRKTIVSRCTYLTESHVCFCFVFDQLNAVLLIFETPDKQLTNRIENECGYFENYEKNRDFFVGFFWRKTNKKCGASAVSNRRVRQAGWNQIYKLFQLSKHCKSKRFFWNWHLGSVSEINIWIAYFINWHLGSVSEIHILHCIILELIFRFIFRNTYSEQSECKCFLFVTRNNTCLQWSIGCDWESFWQKQQAWCERSFVASNLIRRSALPNSRISPRQKSFIDIRFENISLIKSTAECRFCCRKNVGMFFRRFAIKTNRKISSTN